MSNDHHGVLVQAINAANNSGSVRVGYPVIQGDRLPMLVWPLPETESV